MISIENIETHGFAAALRGMRNPHNSWEKSDSWNLTTGYKIGDADHELAMKLSKAGPVHSKYLRMITVTMDITAPLYWWKEFDTYKVGTVCDSCSTMHSITKKEFTMEDFSTDHLRVLENSCGWEFHFSNTLRQLIAMLNVARQNYLETEDKEWWWQIIQLLPSSYNQRRTVQLNYAVLQNIYRYRRNHKLDEWQEFCRQMHNLPYPELFEVDADVI